MAPEASVDRMDLDGGEGGWSQGKMGGGWTEVLECLLGLGASGGLMLGWQQRERLGMSSETDEAEKPTLDESYKAFRLEMGCCCFHAERRLQWCGRERGERKDGQCESRMRSRSELRRHGWLADYRSLPSHSHAGAPSAEQPRLHGRVSGTLIAQLLPLLKWRKMATPGKVAQFSASAQAGRRGSVPSLKGVQRESNTFFFPLPLAQPAVECKRAAARRLRLWVSARSTTLSLGSSAIAPVLLFTLQWRMDKKRREQRRDVAALV
ncbi:hypothetical protein L1887_50231 [Cichorium endivia]|nr:hypothetical protein L1887_50231 [Cichorium endivia]